MDHTKNFFLDAKPTFCYNSEKRSPVNNVKTHTTTTSYSTKNPSHMPTRTTTSYNVSVAQMQCVIQEYYQEDCFRASLCCHCFEFEFMALCKSERAVLS